MTTSSRFFRNPFRRSLAATIHLDSAEVANDPFPHYERLRAGGSVQYLARHDAWIVLGYDDTQAILTNAESFSNSPYAHFDDVLLAADPPEHTPVRRIVARAFTADVIARLGTFADEYARALLRPRLDVVSEYAVPLSAAVAAQLLGVNDDDLARIQLERNTPVSRSDSLFDLLDELAPNTATYVRLIREGLDDRRARSLVRLLWLAATTTTERAIARAILLLLQHPEARDSRHLERFINETLRLHPPELIVRRRATRSVRISGESIPAGAEIYVCLAAANRDPARFEHASELRLDRPSARIFSFGSGIHHCVGSTLARRVIEAAVRTLLVHAPDFRSSQRLENRHGVSTTTSNPVGQLLLEL